MRGARGSSARAARQPAGPPDSPAVEKRVPDFTAGPETAVAKGLAMLHPTRIDRLLHAARRFLDSVADGAGRGFVRR